MPAWDFQRSITSMRLMVDLATEQGLPAAKALAGTQVSQIHLLSPDAVVEAWQELRLIENLVAQLKHVPALGLNAGQRYHFTAFGALGFAMASSHTLGDALAVALKYIQLTFAFCRVELQDNGQHCLLSMDASELPPAVRRFIVERDSACAVTLLRDMFSVPTLLEAMHFTYAAPAYAAAYQAFYTVAPQFNANRNSAILSRSLLVHRLPQANPLALAIAGQQCEALLNQRKQRGGLAAQLRSYLATHAAHMPGMGEAANQLHMIPRTLRRKLANEHTSFAELRDEVRQTLAREYLTGPRLSVERIAERLGYADATGFINAYKRWHGVTPHAQRLDALS